MGGVPKRALPQRIGHLNPPKTKFLARVRTLNIKDNQQSVDFWPSSFLALPSPPPKHSQKQGRPNIDRVLVGYGPFFAPINAQSSL